jgi:hypothetical protein
MLSAIIGIQWSMMKGDALETLMNLAIQSNANAQDRNPKLY